MKAHDLLADLIHSSGFYPENTVDKIIIGDPDKEIKKLQVTWISSMHAVTAAIEGGYDAIITHEPTFYMHRDELENLSALPDGSFMKYAGLMKKKLIDDSGMVVLRIHDSWDKRPVYGIADAWAQALGFGKAAACSADGYQRRHDIEPVALDNLAKRVASCTAAFGEAMVQVIGDSEQIVSRVCIGPGYCSTVEVGRELGCDVNILCDDSTLFWREIQCAADMGYPIIRVNHGTSEEPGMVRMAVYINERYPDIHADKFTGKPYFRMVSRQ